MASKKKSKLVLDELDQEQSLTQEVYKTAMRDYQLELLKFQRLISSAKHSVMIVVEGPDAAGKGGAIKRLVEKLDPRGIRVYSVIKPTAEEYQHHYLWRFWNKLPAYGQIAIFDRSWYGRVLVERVEGFAKDEEWKRAYQELNEFERTLTDDGAIILKFYLHITKDEQLERFKKREADPYKNWKITDEDWRNRRKWNEHNEAAEEMIELTNTSYAPWHVVPANYKWFARTQILKTAVRRLEKLNLKV